MGASVDAKIKASGNTCPDRDAVREDEVYFRNSRPQKQGYLKVAAVMLSCASGALLASMNFVANQNSLIGITVDIAAVLAGATLGYWVTRQRR